MPKTPFADHLGWPLALQSLYDLVPVILFFLGTLILIRSLYHKMVKGNYTLLAAGSIMVLASGFFKALHKFLMAVAHIDYVILDKQFTSTSSVGFLLLFLAMLGMFTPYNRNHLKDDNQGKTLTKAIIPFTLFVPILAEAENKLTPYTSSLPFIILMIIGAAGFLVMLCILALRMKVISSFILFLVSILFMVMMGYLSTKHYFEWAFLQITSNVIYQGSFFLGSLLLKKHGLEDYQL